MLYSYPNFFPFAPSTLHPPSLQQSPPYFMTMGCAYEFFSFSIFYTILNIPLSILDLSIMLLNPECFLSFSPFPLPVDNPPSDLHIYNSVPVLFICLVVFLIQLFIVVNLLPF